MALSRSSVAVLNVCSFASVQSQFFGLRALRNATRPAITTRLSVCSATLLPIRPPEPRSSSSTRCGRRSTAKPSSATASAKWIETQSGPAPAKSASRPKARSTTASAASAISMRLAQPQRLDGRPAQGERNDGENSEERQILEPQLAAQRGKEVSRRAQILQRRLHRLALLLLGARVEQQQEQRHDDADHAGHDLTARQRGDEERHARERRTVEEEHEQTRH